MTDTVEFEPWPKMGRINKNVVFTEKIDGTNAAIGVRVLPPGGGQTYAFETDVVPAGLGPRYAVRCQSRKRLITPDADNFGFASWVFENAELLAPFLGEGLHFGEWWGSGIQRGYDLDGKRFSLFNTHRWAEPMLTAPEDVVDAGLRVVPVLGVWGGNDVGNGLRQALEVLRLGSAAALQEDIYYDRPEGVVTYWTASNTLMKYLIENPDTPKGLVA